MTETVTKEAASMMAKIEERRNELAEVKFAQGGQLFQPKDGLDLTRMANMMAASGDMVAKIFRGNAGACMGLISIVVPYGLNPYSVSFHVYRVKEDAPLAFEAKVMTAMIDASGILKEPFEYKFHGEGDSLVCTCIGTLKSGAVREWESPPIGTIQPKNSPLWKTKPRMQLAYNTARDWIRTYVPESFLGIYTVDEMQDAPAIGPDRARDITPRPGGAVYADTAKPETPHDPITGEIVDDETPLLPQARAAAGGGRVGFTAWWNTLDKGARAPLMKHMAELEKLADQAEAAQANRQVDPGPNGTAIDFDKIARLIQRDIEDIDPTKMQMVRDTYADELAALLANRPEAHAQLEKLMAEREAAA